MNRHERFFHSQLSSILFYQAGEQDTQPRFAIPAKGTRWRRESAEPATVSGSVEKAGRRGPGLKLLRGTGVWVKILVVIFGLACSSSSGGSTGESDYAELRKKMVEEQLAARQISDPRVLAAMARVPRHELVPPAERSRAYVDAPLPIGFSQTISQPFIVALMTEVVTPVRTDRVLEVGTGSGYQAAVLGEICDAVFSIEIVPELAERAARDLERLGYRNVTVRQGDGYLGWPEEAPFDIIVITAAAPSIPQPLLDQLAPGGRLVMPVGPVSDIQELTLVRRQGNQFLRTEITPVRFVPLTRENQRRPPG